MYPLKADPGWTLSRTLENHEWGEHNSLDNQLLHLQVSLCNTVQRGKAW